MILLAIILSAFLTAAGDHAALYQGQIEPAFVQAAWTTHPYWSDEEFHTGDICFDGTLYSEVPMRYNILLNQLAVITPVGRLVVIPDQEKISWFCIEGERYERQGGWFMHVEQPGQHVKLLHQKAKVMAGDVIIDGHYIHSLAQEDHYYMLLPSGQLREVSSLKSLYKALPTYKEELRQLSKNQRLRFDRRTRAGSLRECVALLEGLEQAKTQTTKTTTAYRLSDYQTHQFDSLLTTVPMVERVPAFYAYTPGSKEKRIYADDVQAGDNPGISRLEAMREARTLEEVQVLGMHGKLSQQISGVEAFRPSLLRNIPLAMGEADVLKLALKLPGVSSTGEAASGINVRGGAVEQTLMLKDGNTVFNPMHLFGLFSAFNPDLVAETELYKGGIPSQYGGRLSSVMNIKSRMPDRQEWHGSASIGLVTAKASVELPLVKDRVSLLLGGRATYSDWMLKLMPKEKDNEQESISGGIASANDLKSYRDGTAGYWDLGGTLSAQLTGRHLLLLNGYYSHDRFALTPEQKYAYANLNFSAEVRSHLDERLSSSITMGYDHYDYANDDTKLHHQAARLAFDLNQYFLKAATDYRLNEDHRLNMGLQGQYYHIMPGSYHPLGSDSKVIARTLPSDNAMEAALWAEDSWELSPDLKLTGGLRLNLFSSMKEGLERTYVAPDLRFSASYMLDENSSVKAGFNTMHQFIHKVSNTVIMSPTDTWMLSNSEVKPQSGWQLSAGYYWMSPSRDYELTAEAYYKGMSDYLTYRNAAILVMNEQLHHDVVGTQGKAYGLELQVRKLYGRLNGWLSYTYSRTQLRQRGSDFQTPINHGHWFAADYDSPHDVKLVCNYKFTRRYSTSVNADYSTGRPFTAPIGQMPTDANPNHYIPIYSDRNTFRMPDYLRLDWAVNVEPSHHLTAKTHSWFTLGVYNLLGRRNAYSIYFESNRNRIQGHQISIFGAPIPYINYNVKF